MTKSQFLRQRITINKIALMQSRIEELEKENEELRLLLKDFVEAVKDNERKQDIQLPKL